VRRPIVAVLRMETGKFGFVDQTGGRFDGAERLLCEMTLRGRQRGLRSERPDHGAVGKSAAARARPGRARAGRPGHRGAAEGREIDGFENSLMGGLHRPCNWRRRNLVVDSSPSHAVSANPGTSRLPDVGRRAWNVSLSTMRRVRRAAGVV